MSWIKRQYYKLIETKDQPVESLHDSTKSSIVISSFARLSNVYEIVETYQSYDCFGEIIVWHNGEGEVAISNKSEKLRVINSDDMGLASRYAAALLSRHETVFLQDDDIIAPEVTFHQMRDRHVTDGYRTVTTEGKVLYQDGAYGKKALPKKGEEMECDVHLNRLICTKRSLVPHFFELLIKTNLHLSPIAGGGEDIVYSYAIANALGLKPIALHLAYSDLSDENAISKRLGNQHANRSKIVTMCKSVTGLS